MPTNILEIIITQLTIYKAIGEKAMADLSDDELYWTYNKDSNSIVVLVKHLAGNMLSRWTDFLITDGEKDWRDRNAEFSNDFIGRDELLNRWGNGWACLFDTLNSLKEVDLNKIVLINRQPITINETIIKNVAHYAYHIGQIVFISKLLRNNENNSYI
jgi:Protein of unknown function (DUF1572)